MRTYPGMRLAPNMGVPQLREELQRADTYLKQVSAAISRVAFAPQGSGPSGGNTGTVPDLTQFWYLPGRLPEQRAFGRNILEGISVSAQGSGTPTTSQKAGIFAHDQNKGIPSVWLGVEGTDHALVNPGHADRPYHQNRYWVFPAFNQLSGGETNGVHYFADTSDFQFLSNKTLSSWVLEAADIAGIGIVEATNRGETESGTTKALMLLFHGSYPTTSWKRTTNSPSGGSYPALAIPPLDVNASVTAPTREKQHILCVMRKDHTDTTPFEDGGPLMGGGSGRELYPLFTGAQGTLGAPSDTVFPLWHPSVTKSCDFVLGSAAVTIVSGTAGIYKGQRMRETAASYSLPEDVHVVSVDSGTQITMSVTWPASNLTRTVQFFGMTWSDSATSITLGAGALADYLYLPGRAAGQTLGNTSHAGGTSFSLAIEGPLLLGNQQGGLPFAAGVALNVFHAAVPSGTLARLNYDLSTLSGVASGTLTALGVAFSNIPGFTSGTLSTVSGLLFNPAISVPSGVTYTNVAPVNSTISFGTTAGGSVTSLNSFYSEVRPAGSAGPTFTNINGYFASPGWRTAVSTVTAFRAGKAALSFYGTGPASQVAAFFVDSTFGATANATVWSGLLIPSITGPGTIWGLDITGTMNNRIAGSLFLGGTASPTHTLQIAAGTATKAPLQFTSGVSLTAPAAGAIEFTTDDFFATITTGAARKAFILDDGARLTSGRVPFATTNGRLVDDADMTFAVDTLTVTKIGATTITGLHTFADATDMVFGTTTGTKLGTAVTQKLGFWNTVPIIQPTTAVAAATFVANTSGIVNDSATFDGYTIGQVVRALRNMGLLA